MSVLSILSSGCATIRTHEIPLLGDNIQVVKEGDIATFDGVFLTEEGTKEVAKCYYERVELREQLIDCPTSWQRFWGHWPVFFTGLVIGVVTGVYITP